MRPFQNRQTNDPVIKLFDQFDVQSDFKNIVEWRMKSSIPEIELEMRFWMDNVSPPEDTWQDLSLFLTGFRICVDTWHFSRW